jgi:predicted O-methyltransferase YrrM
MAAQAVDSGSVSFLVTLDFMYSRFQLAKKYIHYCFSASNGKGHGVHSPFVFDFIKNVLNDKRTFYAYEKIESLRKKLLNDKTVLHVDDFGAGSAIRSTKKRSISSIARNAAKSPKLSQLLFRMVHYYRPETVLELGTSLGISSAYMAAAAPSAKVTTIEGAFSVANAAKDHHRLLELNNIDVRTGKFDEVLPVVLQQLKTIDFAFIDGNHRYGPTKNYFEQIFTKVTPRSILIFDDIHWSIEMEEAWKFIKEHEAVKATIDLFFIGIVFFDDAFKSKQQFIIRF